ncbi:MAG: hypothetical protein ISS18_15900 [Bacteroidales bacterium]|nr:hypothetical protein [Bacteroidales bacterium]
MLQLFADNQPLDISGVKFNITLKNPMFDKDKFEGSYIFNLKLPLTSRNKKIFGFPGRLEKYSANQSNDFSYRALFNGTQIIDNAIISVIYQHNNYTTNVKVTSGSFINRLKDMSLKNLDLGGNRTIGSAPFIPINHYNNTLTKEYPDSDYVYFPIYNLNFYDNTDVENDYKNNIQFINFYYNNTFQPGSPDSTGGTFCAFPYLAYILDQIFKAGNVNINKNPFFSNTELRRLVIYNNHSLTATTSAPNPNPPYNWFYFPKAHHRLNLINQVPDYNILDLLNDLKIFGISYFFNNTLGTLDIMFLKDILHSTDYIDLTNVIDYKKIDLTKNDGYKLSYDFREPYSNKYIKDFEDVNLKEPVQALSDLPEAEDTEINEVRYVIDVDKYYIFKYYSGTQTGVWHLFSYNFLDKVLDGDNIFEIHSNTSPLMVRGIKDFVSGIGNRQLLCPIVEQIGSNPFFINNDGYIHNNSFDSHLLFYRGLQHDSLNASYPLGSNDVYDYGGNKISNANISLKFDGDYGLYNNFWSDYFNWILNITTKVILKKLFSPIEINQFDFSKKYRHNGIDYLIKSIKIPVTEKAILPATMECYKV